MLLYILMNLLMLLPMEDVSSELLDLRRMLDYDQNVITSTWHRTILE